MGSLPPGIALSISLEVGSMTDMPAMVTGKSPARAVGAVAPPRSRAAAGGRRPASVAGPPRDGRRRRRRSEGREHLAAHDCIGGGVRLLLQMVARLADAEAVRARGGRAAVLL